MGSLPSRSASWRSTGDSPNAKPEGRGGCSGTDEVTYSSLLTFLMKDIVQVRGQLEVADRRQDGRKAASQRR